MVAHMMDTSVTERHLYRQPGAGAKAHRSATPPPRRHEGGPAGNMSRARDGYRRSTRLLSALARVPAAPASRINNSSIRSRVRRRDRAANGFSPFASAARRYRSHAASALGSWRRGWRSVAKLLRGRSSGRSSRMLVYARRFCSQDVVECGHAIRTRIGAAYGILSGHSCGQDKAPTAKASKPGREQWPAASLKAKVGPGRSRGSGHRPLCRRQDARAADHAGPDPAAYGRADRGDLPAGPQVRERAPTGSPRVGCSRSRRRWASMSAISSMAWTANGRSSRCRNSACSWSSPATSPTSAAASVRTRCATSPARWPNPSWR